MQYIDSDLDPIFHNVDFDDPKSMSLWWHMPAVDAMFKGGMSYKGLLAYVKDRTGLTINIVVLKSYLTAYRFIMSEANNLFEKTKDFFEKKRKEEEEEQRKISSFDRYNNKPSPCFVYFILCEMNSLIKIGYSQNPYNRIKAIEHSHPGPLKLMKHVPGSPDYEAELHKKFAHLRRHREWFAAEQELLDFIESLPVEFAA